MTKEELDKLIQHEINWLRYYSVRSSKEALDLSQNTIYEQMIPMGYVKRPQPLDLRCSGYICIEYIKGTNLEDLHTINERRDIDNNKFSPLEVYVKLFPEERERIKSLLNASNT